MGQRLGIGTKIMLSVGVAAILILGGMTSFYTRHEEQDILEQNHRARIDLLETMIHGLRAVMLTGSAEIAQTFAAMVKQSPGLLDARILRRDGSEAFLDNHTIDEVNWLRGKDIFHPKPEERVALVLAADDPHLRTVLRERRIVSYQEEGDKGEKLLSLLAPIVSGKECHLCHGQQHGIQGVVKLTTSLEPVYQAIAAVRWRAIQLAGVSLLALLGLVHFLTRKIVVEKLVRVTRAMSMVAGGDLHTQVTSSGDDEVRTMVDSFNTMVGQLLVTYDGFQQERNKLATIILSAREGMIVTDAEEHVVLVNPAAERLLGKSAQRIASDGFYKFMDDPDYVRGFMDSEGKDFPDTVVFNQRVLQLNAARIRDANNAIIGSAALLRDITEEKKLEDELRYWSFTDKLTGLFNRRRMEELLNMEFERSRRYGYPLTVLLFDVDHFKRFNDQHGHATGDRVLEMIGRVMKEHFRKTDYPCRYGGEEFCVILTSTPTQPNKEGAFIAADRFRQKVAMTLVEGLQVTISIGIGIYPHEGVGNPDDLLKMADQALYRAKLGGRNRVELPFDDRQLVAESLVG